MNINKLETTDIFRGAFFLCMGGSLCDVRLKEDRRRMVSFMIEGDNLARLDMDYRSGMALVNPLHFRETLNHLRDILFNKLREDGPASSNYAATKRRTRHGAHAKRRKHTQRKDRTHQKHG